MHGVFYKLIDSANKKNTVCLIILIATLLLAIPTHAVGLQPVSLQLKWFHQFQFAGYYAAKEKGFYKDEGLDVNIIERDLKLDPVDEVLKGNADFGVSNSALLLDFLEGKDVVLLASIFQHSPLVFISKTPPLLHDPHDLIGKRVLMSMASQDVELRAMLLKQGISLDKISLIDRFATPEDYFNNNIDVIAAYTTNQPFYLEQDQKPYSVIYPSTYGIDFYGDTLFTSRALAVSYPEKVRKFLRASIKGWIYALEHTDELIEIIINKYGSLKTREHLKFEADAIKKLIQPDLIKVGHTNPARWKHIGQSFRSIYQDLPERKLSDFFFDPTAGRLVLKQETAVFVTALFSLIIIILFFTLHIARKLKKEISTRKIFENKLKNSEKYYRSLFENTGTATVILSEDHIIKRCNINFAELCGLDVRDIENKVKWTDFVAPNDLPRMREYSKARSHENISVPNSYDFKFVCSNGEVRNVHVYVEKIDGSPDRVASIVDMTEKVKTQDLLIQTEKMLSVGGLAAGMAHEINNPLAGILQATQNIKRRVSPDTMVNDEIARNLGCSCDCIYNYLDERGVIRMLDGIKSSGERAALIVKNMLDFTRKNEVGKTGCNVNDLLDGIVDIISCDYDLRKKYDFRHTEIVKDYDENMDLVTCYRIEIEQVLLNMIKNAAYAMYETSKLRQPRLTLRTRQDKESITIEVEDNGPGMSNEVKRRIFEPFFTTKSPGLGTGLGLSVSFFIITQNHHGTFEVETEIGRGSKFTIKLPKDNLNE